MLNDKRPRILCQLQHVVNMYNEAREVLSMRDMTSAQDLVGARRLSAGIRATYKSVYLLAGSAPWLHRPHGLASVDPFLMLTQDSSPCTS